MVEPQVDAPVAPSAPIPLTPEAQNFKAVIERAATDPAFAELPEVKPIVEKAKEFQAKNAKPQEEKKDDSAGDEKGDSAEVKEETEDVDNPFQSREKEPVKFDTEKFPTIIKEKFGIENPDKFIPAVNKWRKDAETLKEVQKNYEAQTDFLASLPEPLYNAVIAYDKGQDWEAPLSTKPNVNYEKPFDKQTAKVLKTYFGDEFKDFDITEGTDAEGNPSPALKQAITVAQKRFEFEKQQYEGTRAEIEDRGKRRAETFKTSALSSVKNLTESFPDFDDKELKIVQSELLSGGINKMFFNPDGSLKDDAAERYALARFGKQVIANTKKSVKVKTENEKNMRSAEENGSPKKVPSASPTQLPTEYSSLTKGLRSTSVYDEVPSTAKN